MARSAARNARTPSMKEISPFPVMDAAEISKLGNRNFETASRAARAYFEGASKLQQELADFFNVRFRKDIKTAQAFMTSKTSEEAFHTQAEFVEGALRDYADGASKMMHLAADMAKDALAPVEERTEEILHSIDERAEPAKKTPAPRASAA